MTTRAFVMTTRVVGMTTRVVAMATRVVRAVDSGGGLDPPLFFQCCTYRLQNRTNI